MKSVLLIGLGRFGRGVAKKLNELNHQVMAVDRNESRVDALLPIVTNAQIGDSTNEAFLRSLGIPGYDVCIVTIGGDFQSSLETTALLKELGGRLVVSRADRDVQAKFLLRNGADIVTDRTISGLTMTMQSMKSRYPQNGSERQSVRSTYGNTTVSRSWLSKKTAG